MQGDPGRTKALPQRFYFYVGEKEDCDLIYHINNVSTVLSAFPQYAVDVEIDPEGEHSEYLWRNKFPDYYAWLSKDGGEVGVSDKNYYAIDDRTSKKYNSVL